MTQTVRDKAELRRTIAARRDALSIDFRANTADVLGDAADRPEFQHLLPPQGAIIAGFRPIRSEIGPIVLMRRLAARGFRLALPRITPAGLVFHMHVIGEALTAGPFGTAEPAPTAAIVEPEAFLTPLLAFDRAGGRLGYGKGYYDGIFAKLPQARRIGLAFSIQEVDAVPREAHDLSLDAILTEKELILTLAR